MINRAVVLISCLLSMISFSGCSYYSSYTKLTPYFETKETWPVSVSGTHSGFALVGFIVPVFPIFHKGERAAILVNDMNRECPVLMVKGTLYQVRKRENDYCFFDIAEPVDSAEYRLQWKEKTYQFKLQLIEFSEYFPIPFFPT